LDQARDRGGIRARVRVPRLASADVSLGTRRTRPRATAAAQASVAPRSGSATADTGADTSPRADADAAATLSRPRPVRLLDLRALESGETPAGIGVLESGPTASGNQVNADVGDVAPSVPVTVCGNGVGVLGDAAASCGADTSSGGIIAPPPGTTGSPGSTGTSGIPGTSGSIPGAGDPITTSAPLRPVVSASGALPFTGAASDLLAVVGAALLAAGFRVVRATRPDTAGKGGGDR
jgi:hypothetical protein